MLKLTTVAWLALSLATSAATISFSDIPSTNVVNSSDLLLIDSHLGGSSYATRTITVSSLPASGGANWVASGLTDSTLVGALSASFGTITNVLSVGDGAATASDLFAPPGFYMSSTTFVSGDTAPYIATNMFAVILSASGWYYGAGATNGGIQMIADMNVANFNAGGYPIGVYNFFAENSDPSTNRIDMKHPAFFFNCNHKAGDGYKSGEPTFAVTTDWRPYQFVVATATEVGQNSYGNVGINTQDPADIQASHSLNATLDIFHWASATNNAFLIEEPTNRVALASINGAGAMALASSLTATGGVATGSPSGGTAAAWKLGSWKTNAVTIIATNYVEVEVGGVLRKLAVVQ